MTTAVTFETATIADVLKKAEMCAPRASIDTDTFSKAAGIVMELQPAEKTVRVMSTNVMVFFSEWVDSVEMEGPAVTWRIPVSKFTGIVSKLPAGPGRTVKFIQEGNHLKLESGKTGAQVMMIDASTYPQWEPYTDADSVVVEELGTRLGRVAWACDTDVPVLSGVHFTGSHLIGGSRTVLARIPCPVPILAADPLTIPATVLASVLRHAGDVRVGLEGSLLTISPDEHTQIKCTVLDGKYPSVKFVEQEYDSSVSVNSDLLTGIIQRMVSITEGGKDSNPTIKMLVGGGALNLRIEGSDTGEWVTDSMDVARQAEHFPVMLTFAAKKLLDSINRAAAGEVKINYDSEEGKKNKVVRIDGSDGYSAWLTQMRTV